SSAAPPALHSFPTRRSSDLAGGHLGLDPRQETQTAGNADQVARRSSARAGTRRQSLQVRRFRQGLAQLIAQVRLVLQLGDRVERSEEHTSELQSRENLVCRL